MEVKQGPNSDILERKLTEAIHRIFKKDGIFNPSDIEMWKSRRRTYDCQVRKICLKKLVREPVCLQFANGPFSQELPTQEIGVMRSHMDSDRGVKLPLVTMASFLREGFTGESF